MLLLISLSVKCLLCYIIYKRPQHKQRDPDVNINTQRDQERRAFSPSALTRALINVGC